MRLGSGAAACALAFSFLSVLGSTAHAQVLRLPESLPGVKVRTAVTTIYQGKLTINASTSLTLVFHLSEGGNHGPSATLDVPEQGAKGLAVTKTEITGDTVTFTMDNIRASFTGKRSGDGKTITGTFTQAGHDLPLVLSKSDTAAGLDRPQTPKPPFPYRTEDVSYANPKAPGVTLAGTLDIPHGKGPFPVVLFITGSGPQDRDEEIVGHRPFFVIADYLARRGIASLRVDDRGIAKSTGNFATATTADFATDTEAGVAFLKTRTDVIDPKRIGLIGHSEGGIIAPMVAANDPSIAFLVLLAGTGVRGDLVLLAQESAIAHAMGMPNQALAQYHATMAKLYSVVVQESDTSAIGDKLKSTEDELVAGAPEAEREGMQRQLDQAMQALASPWLQFMLRYDPQPTLKTIHCPVLALDGSRDMQVIPAQNLPAIQGALTAGGNKDVTVQLLQGLNHLFQHAKTGAPSEYLSNTETFAPEALKVIGDWIVAHTK